MKVWILTEEYNAYDQYGEYFVAVYADKPTAEQIACALGGDNDDEDRLVRHVLAGGGRRDQDHFNWYHLREHDLTKE